MVSLSHETHLVQNPALGAMLLWRFVHGYERGSGTHDATPLPLLFIVLPIIFHQETASFVKSTREASGLRYYADKFRESRNSTSDLILTIHGRALAMRGLSSQSMMLAVTSGLMSVRCETGQAVSLSSTAPKAGIPAEIKTMLASAEKLGVWCSQVSLHEVSVILKVGF